MNVIQQHQKLIQENIQKSENEAKVQFIKSTLDNFGQVLTNAAADNTSVARIRLAKMQELANMNPHYYPESFNT